MFNKVREEFSDEASDVVDTINHLYKREFGYGPIQVSVEDAVSKLIGVIPSPSDRTWVDDVSRGATTVTMLSKTDAARDSKNIFSMFKDYKLSPYDGHILKNGQKKKIVAPFSTYYPTVIWPYSTDGGGRYTVHDFARKDLPIPDWAQTPIQAFTNIDLDIDQDGKPDYGGLPLFRFLADPLMGIIPIGLLLLMGYIASFYIPTVAPLILTP